MSYGLKTAGFFTVELEEERPHNYVWLITLCTNDETSTYVFDSSLTISAFLYNWVREHWNPSIDGDIARYDGQEAVPAYFSVRSEEYYELCSYPVHTQVDVDAGLPL